MNDDEIDVAETLAQVADGDPTAAEHLAGVVYDRMLRLAGHMLRNESPGLTLQPTALVNEAFLLLVDQSQVEGVPVACAMSWNAANARTGGLNAKHPVGGANMA